mgnify:CR=1 FL=1
MIEIFGVGINQRTEKDITTKQYRKKNMTTKWVEVRRVAEARLSPASKAMNTKSLTYSSNIMLQYLRERKREYYMICIFNIMLNNNVNNVYKTPLYRRRET